MQVTCSGCSRRFKAKALSDNICKCGRKVNPLSEDRLRISFSNYDYASIQAIRKIFMNGSDLETKVKLIDLLLVFASKEPTRKLALLSSIEVLRLVEGAEYIDLAKRIVETWPNDYNIRYMYAYCLDLSIHHIDHYEALKQRLVATALHCIQMKKRNVFDADSYRAILEKHLERLGPEKQFLDGKVKYPTLKIRLIEKNRTVIDEALKGPITDLQRIGDVARLREPFIKRPKVTCILDTNALSNRDSSYYFGLEDVQFLIPPEVLLELANWKKISQIPKNLQFVEVKNVHIGMPSEVQAMRCKNMNKLPSIADKKVAMLAIQERADAIISSDHDLLGTGIPELVEKQWGKRLSVVRPTSLGAWLKKNVHEPTVDSISS